jgi:DNA-binding XRE family transcriptional regulator
MRKLITPLDRLALAIQGQRLDLGLSRRTLAACSEVSEATIVRIEAGVRVRPANLIRVALALTALELYGAPAPEQLAVPLTPFPPPLVPDEWEMAS